MFHSHVAAFQTLNPIKIYILVNPHESTQNPFHSHEITTSDDQSASIFPSNGETSITSGAPFGARPAFDGAKCRHGISSTCEWLGVTGIFGQKVWIPY